MKYNFPNKCADLFHSTPPPIVSTRLRNPKTKKIPNATYLEDILGQLEGTTVLWDKTNFGAHSDTAARRQMNE